jgi:rubrerythrin
MNVSDQDTKIIRFIKQQIIVENEIVSSVNQGIKNIRNPPVRGILKGISLDSMKHAELYASAVQILSNVSQALSQENLDEQKALVEKHIRIEAELIKKLEDELPAVSDDKVKFLLNAILADERRHHALLIMVLETIVRRETITEQDWWDMLWQGAPDHGTPGGA